MTEENTAAKMNSTETIPFRCTICGKLIARFYPETIPGVIYATCRVGHKIKVRKEDLLPKAV